MIKQFVAISFRHSEWKDGKKTDIEKLEMMEVKKLSTFSLSPVCKTIYVSQGLVDRGRNILKRI